MRSTSNSRRRHASTLLLSYDQMTELDADYLDRAGRRRNGTSCTCGLRMGQRRIVDKAHCPSEEGRPGIQCWQEEGQERKGGGRIKPRTPIPSIEFAQTHGPWCSREAQESVDVGIV